MNCFTLPKTTLETVLSPEMTQLLAYNSLTWYSFLFFEELILTSYTYPNLRIH